MALLVAILLLLAAGCVTALFVHAVRADSRNPHHGWLAIVPLLILGVWVLETMLLH